jgi:hypothetical protein
MPQSVWSTWGGYPAEAWHVLKMPPGPNDVHPGPPTVIATQPPYSGPPGQVGYAPKAFGALPPMKLHMIENLQHYPPFGLWHLDQHSIYDEPASKHWIKIRIRGQMSPFKEAKFWRYVKERTNGQAFKIVTNYGTVTVRPKHYTPHWMRHAKEFEEYREAMKLKRLLDHQNRLAAHLLKREARHNRRMICFNSSFHVESEIWHSPDCTK